MQKRKNKISDIFLKMHFSRIHSKTCFNLIQAPRWAWYKVVTSYPEVAHECLTKIYKIKVSLLLINSRCQLCKHQMKACPLYWYLKQFPKCWNGCHNNQVSSKSLFGPPASSEYRFICKYQTRKWFTVHLMSNWRCYLRHILHSWSRLEGVDWAEIIPVSWLAPIGCWGATRRATTLRNYYFIHL